MMDNVTEDARQEQEISLTQLLGIIRQRRQWIVLFLILSVGAAILYLKVTNPTYQASATALVEPISSANSIESLLSAKSSSSKIDTEVQLITSNSNLQSALDRLDLSHYLDPDGVPYSDPEKDLKGSSFIKKVSVTTVSNTKIVKVTVEDWNKEFCADYANAILMAYTEMLTGIAKNSKSAQVEFLEAQIPETESNLAEATIALSDYKEKSGIIQMTEKNTLLNQKIAAFQMEMEPLKLQLIETQSIMAALNAESSLPKVEEIGEAAEIKGLLADYIANSKELIMYQSIENSENSRVFVLKNAIDSKSKDLLNAVNIIVGRGNATYAKAVVDYLCVSASITAIEQVIEVYDEELADFPIIEREYQEKARDVQIYQSLLLSLRQLLEETRMVEAAVVGNVTIVDYAKVPIDPVSPKKMMIVAIAVVGGAVIGVLFGLLLEFTDNSIRSEDSIKQILGRETPSLGWTPFMRSIGTVKWEFPSLFVMNDPESNISERFRAISNNIAYSIPEKVQVLSINSTEMNEGKTTCICNVAASYAMAGKKVILIDGDFRKPAIEPFFKLRKSRYGVVDVVINDVPLEKCIIRPIDQIPNLHILPIGMGTRNPNALYNSDKFGAMINKLKTVYDYVIVDCPPLSYGSEFTHLAKHLDGYVLNIRAGIATKNALIGFARDLEFIQAPLLGYVYYGVIARNHSSYGYNSYGNYGAYSKKYGYGSETKSMYEEEHVSYRRIYKRELKKRQELTYGKREPVLAFSKGAGHAFASAVKMGADPTSSPDKPARQTVKPVTDVQDKTLDILADIEKDFANKDE